MDRILIKDLLVQGIIGINDLEREHPQDILVNITLFVDLKNAGETDNLADTVNYSTVTQKVQDFVKNAHRFTVEALASDLARVCLDEPGVLKVLIRVEKPGAVQNTKSVGVEIERDQDWRRKS